MGFFNFRKDIGIDLGTATVLVYVQIVEEKATDRKHILTPHNHHLPHTITIQETNARSAANIPTIIIIDAQPANGINLFINRDL